MSVERKFDVLWGIEGVKEGTNVYITLEAKSHLNDERNPIENLLDGT